MGQFDFDLEGKTTVITGGARGIGRSIAEAYAKARSNLVIADIDIDEALKTGLQLSNQYAGAIYILQNSLFTRLIQFGYATISVSILLSFNMPASSKDKPCLNFVM